MARLASNKQHELIFLKFDQFKMQLGWRKQLRKLISLRHFCEYILIRNLVALMQACPLVVSMWIARRIGDLLYFLMGKRRSVALENLDIVFGTSKRNSEKRRLALETFRHLVTSFIEFSSIRKYESNSKKYFRLEGVRHLESAFKRGKGVILVMSHLGPWEFLGFVPHLTGHPCTVLGKTVRNPHFNKWVQSLRRNVSVETCDEVSRVREILTQLEKNELVAIAIDQWAGNDGLWLDFFGRAASTTSLPARFAKKTGCALVPAYCLRTGDGRYEIQIKPEILISRNRDDYVERTTLELNHQLEKQILAYPEQWVWTHKRWKGKKKYENYISRNIP